MKVLQFKCNERLIARRLLTLMIIGLASLVSCIWNEPTAEASTPNVTAEQQIPLYVSNSFDNTPLGSPGSDWSGTSGWSVLEDPAGSENRLLRHSMYKAGTAYPTLTGGLTEWGDQALEFRFKWDGNHEAYYIFSAAVRQSGGKRYRLIGTEPHQDGKLYFTLVREGYSMPADWTAWDANLMDSNPKDGVANPNESILSKYAVTMTANEWYTVMLRAKGNILQVFLDGKQVGATVVDSLNISPNGNIALDAAASVLLDDVNVWNWSGAPAVTVWQTGVSGAAPASVSEPLQIVQGQKVDVSWKVVGAQAVALVDLQGNVYSNLIEGQVSVQPTADRTYRLMAMGTQGKDIRTLQVNVHPPANVKAFQADKSTVIAGEDVMLSWQTSGVEYVTIDGVSGQYPANGQLAVKPNITTNYTLRAVGPANTATASLSVIAGKIAALRITPEFLPDLDQVTESQPLVLGAQYVLDNGATLPVTVPIGWSYPMDRLLIAENGQVSLLQPPSGTSGTQGTAGISATPILIKATVEGREAVRYLYPATPPDLLADVGFEQSSSGGWNATVWQGACQFERTQLQSFAGNSSYRLNCSSDGRVGVYNAPAKPLTVGTYRIRGYMRGLNIKDGLYGQTTDLMVYNHATAAFSNQRLLKGSFGWTPFEQVVKLTESEWRLYIRLFGRGTLWVDQLTIARLADDEPEGFRIGPAMTATPNPCEEDQLNDGGHGGLTLKPAKPLTDAGSGKATPFIPSGLTVSSAQMVNAGVSQSLLQVTVANPTGGYLDAWHFNGLVTDWSGYDYLEFEVYNLQSTIKDFYVEIRDAQTTDYWSRVNWYDKLVPGRNQLRIPLQIFVGERIQIKTPRRLNLAQITRFVLSFPEAGAYFVSDARLTQEPFRLTKPSGLRAFDFGTDTSPVMTGFRPITGTTDYAPCRGYGLVGNGVWRIEDRRSPDALCGDWISFKSNSDVGGPANADDFLVDVPNGEYYVHVFWEDSGYWEWYSNYALRTVAAEGSQRCVQTMTYSEFLLRYYAFEDVEGHAGIDTWERYVKQRFAASCVFTVGVTDGQLNFDFAGNSPYAATINALVIYPTGSVAAAEEWLAQLEQLRKSNFADMYRQIDIAHAQGDDVPAELVEVVGDWLFFQRDSQRDVYLNTVPKKTELVTQLAVRVLRSERVQVPFAVYARVDLGKTVGLTVSGLPAGVTYDGKAVLQLLKRQTTDGTVYAYVPYLLEDVERGVTMAVNQSRSFWLAFDVAKDAPSGIFPLQIRIQTSSGELLMLPLQLEILPLTLPAAPLRYSVLGTFPTYTGGEFAKQLNDKQWGELPAILKVLRSYGMNALTGGFTAECGGATFGSGGSTCDTSQAERFLQTLKTGEYSAWLNTYANLGEGNRADWERWFANQQAGQALTVAGATNQLYSQFGMQLTWSMYDEPSTVESLTKTIQMVDWVHAKLPGVLTSGYHSVHLTDPVLRNLQNQLFQKVDLPFVTLVTEQAVAERAASGKPWGLYNSFGRYGYGLYAWMLHKKYGLTDQTVFALNSMQSDPYYDLDSREADYGYIYTTSTGAIRPTQQLVRLAQAIDDVRYLEALQQAIASADDPQRPKVVAARQWLEQVIMLIAFDNRDRVENDLFYRDLRAQVIKHLMDIEKESTPPPAPAGLAVAAVTMTSVRISWQPVSADAAVREYMIYRDGLLIASTKRNFFTSIRLKPGTEYLFTVVAVDKFGNRSPATSLSQKTLPDTLSPSKIRHLGVVRMTASDIAVSWKAATDNVAVSHYLIYRNGVYLGTTRQTNYTFTGLSAGRRYQLTIVAVDRSGNRSPATRMVRRTHSKAVVGAYGVKNGYF